MTKTAKYLAKKANKQANAPKINTKGGIPVKTTPRTPKMNHHKVYDSPEAIRARQEGMPMGNPKDLSTRGYAMAGYSHKHGLEGAYLTSPSASGRIGSK
jgi:hypothetical protein